MRECELKELRELFRKAIELSAKNDPRGSLETLRVAMKMSLELILSELGMTSINSNLLSLYYLIPNYLRPPVGERELENFEFEYKLAVDSGGPVDRRFLDASFEIAQKLIYWSENIIERIRKG